MQASACRQQAGHELDKKLSMELPSALLKAGRKRESVNAFAVGAPPSLSLLIQAASVQLQLMRVHWVAAQADARRQQAGHELRVELPSALLKAGRKSVNAFAVGAPPSLSHRRIAGRLRQLGLAPDVMVCGEGGLPGIDIVLERPGQRPLGIQVAPLCLAHQSKHSWADASARACTTHRSPGLISCSNALGSDPLVSRCVSDEQALQARTDACLGHDRC